MTTKLTHRITDLFKPLKRLDRLTTVYVYADGHATASFERYVRDADTHVRYYKQIDSLGLSCRFEGRIIFSDFEGIPWLRAMLAAGANRLHAYVPTVDSGSENTRALNIALGCVKAGIPGVGEVRFNTMPGLIGWGIHYDGAQAKVCEEFDREILTYGGTPVAETLITVVHPLTRDQANAA